MPSISSVAVAALGAGVLAATIVDVRTRKIPNALTATIAGVGFGFAASGISGVSLVGAVLGFLVGLVLMLPGHVLGATGAGDVKLMAAVGTLVGPGLAFKAVLFTAVAGGVLAVIVAVRRGRLSTTVAGTARLIATPGDARKEIGTATPGSRFAYGPAIAVGTMVAALLG